jgi:hypothetical protein
MWPEDNAVMGVLGYKEARATATNITLPNGLSVATVCLPMLAILKLLAWSERHTYTPRKDASDLFLIDHRDDGVTVINRQRTARQEIVLHIDDDKRVIFFNTVGGCAGHVALQTEAPFYAYLHGVSPRFGAPTPNISLQIRGSFAGPDLPKMLVLIHPLEMLNCGRILAVKGRAEL